MQSNLGGWGWTTSGSDIIGVIVFQQFINKKSI